MNENRGILIKEIDRYKSLKHSGRMVSEFILYEMIGQTPISAITEITTLEDIHKRFDWYTTERQNPLLSPVKIVTYE